MDSLLNKIKFKTLTINLALLGLDLCLREPPVNKGISPPPRRAISIKLLHRLEGNEAKLVQTRTLAATCSSSTRWTTINRSRNRLINRKNMPWSFSGKLSRKSPRSFLQRRLGLKGAIISHLKLLISSKRICLVKILCRYKFLILSSNHLDANLSSKCHDQTAHSSPQDL